MAKFSGTASRPQVTSPVVSTGVLDRTYEGGAGHVRDPRSELFLLAVANMVSEHTFYESAGDRDQRFTDLIHEVAREDPDWIARFVPYLRDEMNMRSAAVVMAAEFVHARLKHVAGMEHADGTITPRQVVASALQRADEPAEIMAYWRQKYGRTWPSALKRGVGDAVKRLYNEYAALKYDGGTRGFRMGDVIETVHTIVREPWQKALFEYLLDQRHHDDWANPNPLLAPFRPLIAKVKANQVWKAMPVEERRAWLESHIADVPGSLRAAGVTWESLSGWLQGPMDAKAWEAIVPSMGYMALLRNLRNFDEAGVSDEVAGKVMATLADPEAVRKSRQFPIRFYTAWNHMQGMRWGPALEMALEASVSNIPELEGPSLILIDASGSMQGSVSSRSEVKRWQLAGLFGIALAKRNLADVYAFSGGGWSWNYNRSDYQSILVKSGASVLRTIPKVWDWPGANGGTNTFGALKATYKPGVHRRVVILTDEQAHDSPADQVDLVCPVYTWNIAGYKSGHLASGKDGQHVFGGLTDAGFKALSILEQYQSTGWPF